MLVSNNTAIILQVVVGISIIKRVYVFFIEKLNYILTKKANLLT